VHGLKADRLAIQVCSYEKEILPTLSFRTITDEAANTEASEALGRARYERDRDEVLRGRAIDADAKEGDAFAKLARYERSLERSLFRALDELRRLQNRRRNRLASSISDAVTLAAGDQNDELSADLLGAASAVENIFLRNKAILTPG
jgi:hypothetical protein